MWKNVKLSDKTIWQSDYAQLHSMSENTVDLWLFWHTQAEAYSHTLKPLLSDDELARANKFYSKALKQRFIIRRAISRSILGHYTEQQPEKISFSLNKYGKPYLSNDDYHFNLSHSEDLVVMAVSKRQIGVDIEFIKVIPDMALVAKHHFSEKEKLDLLNLPSNQQIHAFYRYWTGKEAFIKADGRGLGIPLDSFDVTLKPKEIAKLSRVDKKWSIRKLDLLANYLGAIVVSGEISTIRYWQVNSSIIHFNSSIEPLN